MEKHGMSLLYVFFSVLAVIELYQYDMFCNAIYYTLDYILKKKSNFPLIVSQKVESAIWIL